MDSLYPAYGFASHVGYITPEHSSRVRLHGPSDVHRRSFQALCYAGVRNRRRGAGRLGTTGCAATGSSARNVWAGGNEIDLIARRGRQLVFCEVKSKGGVGRGDPLEMVGRREAAATPACSRGLARDASGLRRPRGDLRGRRRARRQARADPRRFRLADPVRYSSGAEGHYPRTDVTRQNGRLCCPGASAFAGGRNLRLFVESDVQSKGVPHHEHHPGEVHVAAAYLDPGRRPDRAADRHRRADRRQVPLHLRHLRSRDERRRLLVLGQDRAQGEPREARLGAGGAAALQDPPRADRARRAADAARLHDPVRAAERVRHRP